jgi:HEAT repeat protein
VAILATKPQTIEEKGGIQEFLEENPIEGLRVIPARKQQDGDTVLEMEPESYLVAQGTLGPEVQSTLRGLDLLLQAAGSENLPAVSANPGEILQLVGKATERSLRDPEANPREPLKALVQLLEELSPEYLLSVLPAERQNDLRGRPTNEVAAQLVEDVAVEWAVKHLAAAPAGPGAIAVEEEVVRALSRSLKATQVATRLLRKLAKIMEDANLPPEVYDRIRQEITWAALSPAEKHQQLMQLNRFSAQQFRRLVNYVKEMMDAGKTEPAIEISRHYLANLDSAPAQVRVEGLARTPELLSTLAAQHTLEFLRQASSGLCTNLLNGGQLDEAGHRAVVHCLLSMAQSAALYEDFEFVLQIASGLQTSLSRDAPQHATCCGKALADLLTPKGAERLVELYLERREDAPWARIAISLLRFLGPGGSEKVFERLAEEPVASNRMRLMRLFAQLGPSGTAAVRGGLGDERWYVVRNACYLAGDLGDAELLSQLSSVLRHPEIRVQHAAVTAIIKSRLPNRAKMLAEALPHLKERVLELVLEELAYLKDPASVDGLERFILRGSRSKATVLLKSVRALASIPSELALGVLGRVLASTSQALPVRKLALAALLQSPFALGRRLLAEFARLAPSDPLATEYQAALGTSSFLTPLDRPS